MQPTHIKNVDLNLLLLFHAVFTERSVSKAGQVLGMSQSGVSHALSNLRQLFQDDLFVRASGAMLPTPRAELLHEAVKELIELLEQRILPVAKFEAATARREFSTAMSDMAEVVALPPLMRAIKQRAPHCTLRNVRIKTVEIEDALESGKTELAIGNVYEPKSNIYQQTLYMHDYAVLACHTHPRLKRGLTLEHYLAEGHLVVETGSDEHLRVTGLLPRGIRRRVEVTVGGLLAVPWLLQGTELLATVPTHLSRSTCALFELQAFPLPLEVPAYAIKTYWHPRSNTDPGHRWFRELVYEVLRQYPEWNVVRR